MSHPLDNVPRHGCGRFRPAGTGDAACHCAVCADVAAGFTREEALRRAADWKAHCLAEFGWYAVHVTGEPGPDTPTGVNSHTHGLAANYGHLDFQIVMPLDGTVAHALLTVLADRVKAGERFEAGLQVARVAARGYKVRLVAAREGDRDVLRVVIPDAEGNLTPARLSGTYLLQYVGTPEGPAPTPTRSGDES